MLLASLCPPPAPAVYVASVPVLGLGSHTAILDTGADAHVNGDSDRLTELHSPISVDSLAGLQTAHKAVNVWPFLTTTGSIHHLQMPPTPCSTVSELYLRDAPALLSYAVLLEAGYKQQPMFIGTQSMYPRLFCQYPRAVIAYASF